MPDPSGGAAGGGDEAGKDESGLPCSAVDETFDGALDEGTFALNGSAEQVAAPQGGKHIRLTPKAGGKALGLSILRTRDVS